MYTCPANTIHQTPEAQKLVLQAQDGISLLRRQNIGVSIGRAMVSAQLQYSSNRSKKCNLKLLNFTF